MIDVSDKFATLRSATAAARVRMSAHTILRIEKNDLPKKDPLIAARWAGIQAAKKTAELIPACHPVPLDHVDIRFSVSSAPPEIGIEATVKAEYKTGVEMEALTAVSIAALTVYDMLKPVDESIEIADIKLLRKSGGIKGPSSHDAAERGYRAAVVVVSDAVSSGQREDASGPAARDSLADMGFEVAETVVVPDEPEQIKETLISLCAKNVDLIVTSGGTGLGPRDCTDRAVREILDREAAGIAEWIRAYGRTRTPYAILSNSIAGMRGRTLIVTLPGSPAGVRESLQALRPSLTHAIRMMRGEGH